MATKIDRGSTFDDTTLTQGGIKDYVYLVNWEDFNENQVLTIDGTSKEMTALTLASGTQGYKFLSSKGSVQIIATTTMRGVTAIDGFDHQLDLRITDVSQLSVLNVEHLRFQKVVAFIPLLTGQHELYGRNVGMRMTEFDYTPGDADTGGTLRILLRTPENDPPEISAQLKVAAAYDITELDSPAA